MAAWTKQAAVEVGTSGQTRMCRRIRQTGPANETDTDRGGRSYRTSTEARSWLGSSTDAAETTAKWGLWEGKPPQDLNRRTGLGSRLSDPVEAGLVLVRPSANMKTPNPFSRGWRRGLSLPEEWVSRAGPPADPCVCPWESLLKD